MKKRWIAAIVGPLALIAAAVFYFQAAHKNVNEYDVVTVTKSKIVKEIKDDGVFNPITRVEVGSKISGNITEIFVKEGDFVKKGDILATVESALADKKLQKTKAKLEILCLQANGMEIIITTNLRHLEQNVKLDKAGIIAKEDLWKAQDDYEKSLNDFESIKAQIREARVDLDIAKIDFENSFVRSSIDGVVLAKYIEIGQTVSAGFSVFKMFDICSPISKLEFFAKVNSIDISAVTVGQKIKIKVNTEAGIKEFNSVVSEKRDNPIIENNIPVYHVIARIDNESLILKPGMTGKFFITAAEKDDVLGIPEGSLKKALAFSGEDKTVVISIGNKMARRRIETGVCGNKLVEISGQEIKEGDLVITGIKKDNASKIKVPPWQSKSGR